MARPIRQNTGPPPRNRSFASVLVELATYSAAGSGAIHSGQAAHVAAPPGAFSAATFATKSFDGEDISMPHKTSGGIRRTREAIINTLSIREKACEIPYRQKVIRKYLANIRTVGISQDPKHRLREHCQCNGIDRRLVLHLLCSF